MPDTDAPKNCDNCGACCMGQNLLPLTGNILDNDGRLSQKTRDKLDQVLFGRLGGDDYCPCIWLNRFTGRCAHYNLRPSFCRDVLQPGDETCLRIRAKHGVKDA